MKKSKHISPLAAGLLYAGSAILTVAIGSKIPVLNRNFKKYPKLSKFMTVVTAIGGGYTYYELQKANIELAKLNVTPSVQLNA